MLPALSLPSVSLVLPSVSGSTSRLPWLGADETRELFNVLIMCICVLLVTNAALDIGLIRHRWRMGLFISRVLGLASGFVFLSWPCDVLFVPLAIGVAMGFCDPRLHLDSMRRNPSRAWALIGFIAALLHHAAGARVLAVFARTTANANTSVCALPLPTMIII